MTPRKSAIGLLLLLWCGLLASFALYWQQTEEAMQAVARERGAALFRLVQLARSWNAGHGTVYVPVTEATPPNPYLRHPRRDVQTQDGVALTLVNPAYLTRQIAEIAQRTEGVRLHITSLKPIRPGNAPDPWERQVLQRFESGLPETIELLAGEAGAPVHRYMAPLRVEKDCLRCHEQQGYRLGDIRGGISVTMPAGPLLQMRDAQRWRSAVGHVLVLMVLSLLVHQLMARTRRHLAELRALNDAQERTIAERTASLSIANAELGEEVARRELAAAVFEHASEAILVVDGKGRIRQVNPVFTELTGYPAPQAIGQPITLLSAGREAPDFLHTLRCQLFIERHWQGEVWIRRRDGASLPCWMSVTRIKGGKPAARYVALLSDISLRKQREDELRHQAQHDALTGLPNRALFKDRLQMAISQARRQRQGFALLLVDLDLFKQVNDQLGHAAGDELLIEVARRLGGCVRGADTVARLGGDEFAAILTSVRGQADVLEVAGRMVALLDQPFQLAAGSARVSGSIGVAIHPEHGTDSATLQQAADHALYTVKRSGRNGYCLAGTPAEPGATTPAP